MANKVIAGDYNGKFINVFMGKAIIVLGIGKRVELNSNTVSRYHVEDEGNKSAKKAVAGGILFGGIGAIVGGVTGKKKNILVKIEFKDGKCSLLQVNQKVYNLIVKNCF